MDAGRQTNIPYVVLENEEVVHEGRLILTDEGKIPKAIKIKGRSFTYGFAGYNEPMINSYNITLIYSISYDPDDIVFIEVN